MIVLDTNVLSELRKPQPDGGVDSWFRTIAVDEIWLCAPAVMEQAHGAELYLLKFGSSRYKQMQARTLAQFAGRILAFDGSTAETAGRVRAARDRQGRPISVGDAMIAAICVVHGAALATRNVRDFSGLDLELINPFETTA
jgi:predicted nucleic acid-binding protein